MPNALPSAVGRRKTAHAVVRLTQGVDDSIKVNGKSVQEYFKTASRIAVAREALVRAESAEHYAVSARVEGGGLSAQAGALRHAIARALVAAEPQTRRALKLAGFLTRDPRAKERKKPGLVKARKAKQWSKR